MNERKPWVVLRGVAYFKVSKPPIFFQIVENIVSYHPDPVIVPEDVKKRLQKMKDWR